MSGDFETLEINQPKISYYQKRLENHDEWLDELSHTIDEMESKLPAITKE